MQLTRATGLVGEQRERMERSSAIGFGKRGRRQRTAAGKGQEDSHLVEMQKDVAVKTEPLCKVEESVELGAGVSVDKDSTIAKDGDGITFQQDSYEENSALENESRHDDCVKMDNAMVRTHQPLLLHRAPRYLESGLQF